MTLETYPDARHEVFNETNNDQVVSDLLAWLEIHVPVRPVAGAGDPADEDGRGYSQVGPEGV